MRKSNTIRISKKPVLTVDQMLDALDNARFRNLEEPETLREVFPVDSLFELEQFHFAVSLESQYSRKAITV